MKFFKKSIALIAVLSLMLSMATIVSAAETRTMSYGGSNLFSVTNVLDSHTEIYEEEDFTEEVTTLVCQDSVVVTVLSTVDDFRIMDHTYEVKNNNTNDTGFIMPDGCPGEKEYWENENGSYRENLAAGTTFTLSQPGIYGVEIVFSDYTSFYTSIEIPGERLTEGSNFTYAYYLQRRENQVENSGAASYNDLDTNNGKKTEGITIPEWSFIKGAHFTIDGLYDILNPDLADPTYVIDKNATITFNTHLSDDAAIIENDNYGDSVPMLESNLCTVSGYNTIKYSDNEWYDDGGEMSEITQILPGMAVKFTKPGDFKIYFKLGFASREERMNIQNNNYGWEFAPTVAFKVIDAAPTAKYTASKVIVNGKEIEFEAYNINDNNYFKLRDVAAAINGTEKQFAVFWDESKNAISLISRGAYTPVGGELLKGDGTSKAAVMTTSLVYKDNAPASFTAYNINGNNYFKLRDLGQAFDFDVSWDGANNCIVVDTTKSYTED